MQERTNMAKDTFSSTHHHSLYNNHHYHSSHHKTFTSSFSERTTMPPKTMGGFDSSSKSSLKRPHSAIQKGGFQYSKEPTVAAFPAAIEQEVLDADILLPSVLPFKKMQVSEKYPKGQSRVRYWKHLKQILQAENYHLYPADEPNYANIESPPSMYPAKKYCDVTGFPAPYTDPRTKLRYANTEVFQKIRNLPEDYVQGYLSPRNAAVVLK